MNILVLTLNDGTLRRVAAGHIVMYGPYDPQHGGNSKCESWVQTTGAKEDDADVIVQESVEEIDALLKELGGVFAG